VPKLTRKQQRFVEEFQVDFNATQAAIRAGYSRRTAKQTGHENLTKPYIAAAVEAERQKLAKAAELDAIEWRKSVAQLARFDIRRVFDEHGNLLPVNKLPDDVAACLSSVKVLRTRTRIDQDEATDESVVEIKVWDKIGL
jgi:phage terminase small subunit